MSGARDRRRFLLLAPALALSPWARGESASSLPLATDLRADGSLSRRLRAPLVILFSLPRCPYCEIVRRSYLGPMHRDPRESGRLIIRQIDIDSDERLVGFKGERTTHTAVARAHGVRAAPVVAFWDGEGRPIADALSGMLLPDFYSAYLEAAIEKARGRLGGRG